MPTKKKSVVRKPAKKRTRIKPVAPVETPIAEASVEVTELYKSCAELPSAPESEPLRILLEEEVLPPRKN